ncbi:hypothetical protein CDAR_96691 [Caerostris darwini]|uniref:Uncharacterized protein n=1 Tax=Caerostris darwini TaxID=1538125 RepID=A0AAV4QW57_9ARAC|nr:hypothetical protein CDAR_96691 [Caerostris darwini]
MRCACIRPAITAIYRWPIHGRYIRRRAIGDGRVVVGHFFLAPLSAVRDLIEWQGRCAEATPLSLANGFGNGYLPLRCCWQRMLDIDPGLAGRRLFRLGIDVIVFNGRCYRICIQNDRLLWGRAVWTHVVEFGSGAELWTPQNDRCVVTGWRTDMESYLSN